jgi:hypothetical protein
VREARGGVRDERMKLLIESGEVFRAKAVFELAGATSRTKPWLTSYTN